MQLFQARSNFKSAVILALLAGTCLSAPSYAADNSKNNKDKELEQQIQMLQQQLQSMQGLQTQVRSLQQQLDTMKAGEDATNAKQRDREAAENAAIIAAGGKVATNNGKEEITMPSPGPVTNKGIKLTFGGFIEAAGIYRNKNESADVGSTFTGVPFPNSPNDHLSEFRGSARQSRLSILAQGAYDKDTLLSAYYEMDFLGAATTSNSNESNSYVPRIRNIYATVDRTDMGLHVLAGQSWSLATLNRVGITPRTEVTPTGIEAQYVVGFNWTRNPQIRLVKDFDQKFWIGVSAESPSAQISAGPGATQAAPLTINNAGAAQLNNGGTFPLDPAPDIIVKAAADPGWGHFEVYGIERWFRDRAAFNNQTTNAGGVGGSMLLPVIPKMLDFQASFLVGKGMGRYGSGQLPDVTTNNLGQFIALPYKSVLLGAVAHPDKQWDLYAYAGTEQLESRYNTVGANFYGYGNPLAINDTGCLTESVGTCNGTTSREYELTGGFWYKFYQGSFGMMEFGIQDQWVKRYVFSGATGGTPGTPINIAMFSFRYYPF